MIGKPKKVAGDEISVARLVVSLAILAPGALALDAIPLITAVSRMGYARTTLLVLAILLLSIAFLWAYEHLKPSSPPTPRRDLAVILFSALLIGLWAYRFTNEVVAVLILGGAGAIVLLPEDWRERLADHLPRM
jgi:RsiW-degrading membrane proteinase PrsW (M82 family)